MHAELMLAAHAFMHGVAQRNRCFFSGLYSRRTDDGAGRSAPLQQFDTWFAQDCQRLIAHIANPEHTLNRLFKAHSAVINAGLVNFGARRSRNLWFERFTAAAGHCGNDGEYNHNCANDDCRKQPCGSLW
jgi:hypothetical protein